MLTELIPELRSFANAGLDQLSQLAADLRCSFGFEPSVRLAHGRCERERGLLSFAVASFGTDCEALVLRQCAAMQAPKSTCEAIRRFLPGAAFVHFGFERNAGVLVSKCYLELPPPREHAGADARLQFLGFKWSMTDRAVAVVTRYRTVAVRSWQEASSLVQSAAGEALRPAMAELLSVATASAGHSDSPHDAASAIQLLQIEEEGSDRKSFDLNLYDLNAPLESLLPTLATIAGQMQIVAADFDAWTAATRHHILGHIATGIHRDRQTFVTIYYGARELRMA